MLSKVSELFTGFFKVARQQVRPVIRAVKANASEVGAVGMYCWSAGMTVAAFKYGVKHFKQDRMDTQTGDRRNSSCLEAQKGDVSVGNKKTMFPVPI